MNTLSPTVKRYILSSAITFLSTFFLILGTNVSALGAGTVTTASIIALISLAARAAFKAVIEAVVGGHADLEQVGSNPNQAPASSPGSSKP